MQETFKRVNQQTAAVNNRQLVIRLLQQHGQLSRSQLVALTDLRGSTLTYITRELLQMKMLSQAGQRVSNTVGQKQQLLQINPTYGWVIGMDVRVGQSQVIIMDAAGQLIGDCLIQTTQDLTKLKQILLTLIDRCCEDYNLDRDRLLGIGLGISGIVDVQTGHIIKSYQFKVRDYPLTQILSDQLNVPVQVDHDANLIALAEQKQGSARGLRDFVVMILDDKTTGNNVGFRAFGSALVLNGNVHRGYQFAAGEIDDHLKPDIQYYGKPSDLERLADPDAPLSQWLEHVAQQVGNTLGTMVNLLDPQAILLAGDRSIANQSFIKQVHKLVNKQRIGDLPEPVEVFTCAFSTQSCARGAALATRDVVLAHAVANHLR